MAMKPEEQRIAIAESVGFTDVRRENTGEFGGLRGNDTNGLRKVIPSYCRDLNAMHEVEKTLTDEQWETYAGYLAVFHQPLSTFKFLHATAAQRARAYLQTLGLWDQGSA